MLRDPRPTAELIATALAKLARSDPAGDDNEALVVLQARGTREVLDTTLALCESPNPKQRALAAEILGELGSPRSFPDECCRALVSLVRNDPDLDVVSTAVFGLGHLGNPDGIPALIEKRHHPNEHVRRGVAFGLCFCGPERAVDALLELMEDPYELARDWATTAIGQTASIDGPHIRDALLKRATDPDPFTRVEALNGLVLRRSEAAKPLLIAELNRLHLQSGHLFYDIALKLLSLPEDTEWDVDDIIAAVEALDSTEKPPPTGGS